jgi:hypothetical protein
MVWIKLIPEKEAGGKLREFYGGTAKRRGGFGDIHRVHGLYPLSEHNYSILRDCWRARQEKYNSDRGG